MLIYLNEDWQDSYGGHLELWDKEVKNAVVKVLPLMNRCVIFNTDEDSFHGHPDPLTTPNGLKRKSIAMYYYTALPIENHTQEPWKTNYVARPNDSWMTKAQVKRKAKRREKGAKKSHQEISTVKLSSLYSRIKANIKAWLS
jgi:hypothetical protein